jgi:serine/threonine protein kinase
MEPQGIKRKRSEIQQEEISQLKYSRTVSYICRELENQINSGKSQPRIDTSTMPVNSEKTASSGYELLQRLGEGTFGLWYKARDKQTQQIVAVKKLEPHDNKWDKHYLRHANIGLALSHRHLRRVLEVVGRKTDAQSLDLRAMLVAEYCDCDLTALIHGARYRDRHLSERHVKSIVHQLLLVRAHLSVRSEFN